MCKISCYHYISQTHATHANDRWLYNFLPCLFLLTLWLNWAHSAIELSIIVHHHILHYASKLPTEMHKLTAIPCQLFSFWVSKHALISILTCWIVVTDTVVSTSVVFLSSFKWIWSHFMTLTIMKHTLYLQILMRRNNLKLLEGTNYKMQTYNISLFCSALLYGLNPRTFVGPLYWLHIHVCRFSEVYATTMY